MKIVYTGTAHNVEVKDNFFMPKVWDETSKAAYTEWLAKMPADYAASLDKTPWNAKQESR